MTETSIDTRDLVMAKLTEMERRIPWLHKKANISYDTLYHCLVRKSFNLSYDNLQAINQALETDFPFTPTKKKTKFNQK